MYKNYDFHTGDMLQERFPYMFNKPNIGFSFYRGWMPIMAGVCIELDHLLGDHRELFYWDQVKEKFGTGRFYYTFAGNAAVRVDLSSPDGLLSLSVPGPRSNEPSALQKEVSALVRAAETETGHCCMVCGQPAQIQSYDGYFLTLCAHHHPDRVRRPGDTHWEAIWELATPRAPERGGS